jgi:hypothetical protein
MPSGAKQHERSRLKHFSRRSRQFAQNTNSMRGIARSASGKPTELEVGLGPKIGHRKDEIGAAVDLDVVTAAKEQQAMTGSHGPGFSIRREFPSATSRARSGRLGAKARAPSDIEISKCARFAAFEPCFCIEHASIPRSVLWFASMSSDRVRIRGTSTERFPRMPVRLSGTHSGAFSSSARAAETHFARIGLLA